MTDDGISNKYEPLNAWVVHLIGDDHETGIGSIQAAFTNEDEAKRWISRQQWPTIYQYEEVPLNPGTQDSIELDFDHFTGGP